MEVAKRFGRSLLAWAFVWGQAPTVQAQAPAYTIEGIPGDSILGGYVAGLGDIDGLEFNPALLLHGEQDIEIHKPIPAAAQVESSGKVVGLYDKGKACLCVLEVETREKESGDPLFTNRFSLFLRGEGGFGGESGPKAGNQPPDRAPDGQTERTLLPQQALPQNRGL